jgi:hypothetical protein
MSPARRLPRWWYCAACLIPLIYLPTLAMRFDFADDGVLVYPGPPVSFSERVQHVWNNTVADYQNTGPFRPVTWAHWEAGATLFGPNDLLRRCARLAWAVLSTAAMLWLLLEFDLHPLAILYTAALAMWNPYRGEIWLGLGLTEAFAMPYAFLCIISAVRAARSPRPLPWDVVGVICLLLCLGIKNTFVALVPALVFLRLTAGGLSLAAGLKAHGYRAACYPACSILPITHFALFKLYPRPSHYETGLTLEQPVQMLRAVRGALSWDFLVVGFALTGLAVLIDRRWANPAAAPQSPEDEKSTPSFWRSHRLPLFAGLILLVSGTVVYFPISGVAGRYTMPAAWGADLCLGVLLSALAGVSLLFWKRLALAALGLGLVAVVITNLGRQDKVTARNAILWQALEHVEQTAPVGAHLAWLGTPEIGVGLAELQFSEGIHFEAHLKARGRNDVAVLPFVRDAAGPWPALVLSGSPAPPPDAGYRLVRTFRTNYWLGRRCFECFLWERASDPEARDAMQARR